MREVYYCRHGITDDLERGIRNRPEASLTATGRQQARQTGETILQLGIVPDVITCSTLLRARQSAQEISDVLGITEIVESPLFDERYCGSAVGMRNQDIKRQYPAGFDTVPGAEKVVEMQERAAKAAGWLAMLSDDIVLVVGHGVAGRAMARHYADIHYTQEFDRQARQATNLGNGDVMRLFPAPVRILEA